VHASSGDLVLLDMALPRAGGGIEAWLPGGILGTALKQKPNITAIVMTDPRRTPSEVLVGVCAFYYPGKNEPCDDVCLGAVFGNFYEGDQVEIDSVKFRTAEGAFQAMKWWLQAHEFSQLDGGRVFALKRKLEATGNVDRTYSGRGSNWKAMQEVLKAKFRSGSRHAESLLATDGAFLLEHNSTPGRDYIWSNNHIGDGKNWLGLQLMLRRDELRSSPRSLSEHSWTELLRSMFDLETGQPWDSTSAQRWRQIVQDATNKVLQHLAQVNQVTMATPGGLSGEVCKRPGCSKPSYDGKPGYCSRTCKRLDAQQPEGPRTQAIVPISEAPTCLRPGCTRPTFNGQPGEYCSRSCRDGKVLPRPQQAHNDNEFQPFQKAIEPKENISIRPMTAPVEYAQEPVRPDVVVSVMVQPLSAKKEEAPRRASLSCAQCVEWLVAPPRPPRGGHAAAEQNINDSTKASPQECQEEGLRPADRCPSFESLPDDAISASQPPEPQEATSGGNEPLFYDAIEEPCREPAQNSSRHNKLEARDTYGSTQIARERDIERGRDDLEAGYGNGGTGHAPQPPRVHESQQASRSSGPVIDDQRTCATLLCNFCGFFGQTPQVRGRDQGCPCAIL